MAIRSLIVVCAIGLASTASAGPVTWEATGTITNESDGLGLLTAAPLGTPWTLAWSFDPTTVGTPQVGCNSPSVRFFAGAIGATTFQLGSATYHNAGGDIFTNADLPVGGCADALGGIGLVQFQWQRGWTGGAGGPDLNAGLGLLLASYNDPQAAAGALPSDPILGTSGIFDGLEWDGSAFDCGAECAQFTAAFTPQVAPVPEPVSALLVVSGIAVLARRRRL